MIVQWCPREQAQPGTAPGDKKLRRTPPFLKQEGHFNTQKSEEEDELGADVEEKGERKDRNRKCGVQIEPYN